jgi:excinuclease ABC subunit C
MGLEDQKVIGLSKPRTERKRGDRDTPDKIVLPHIKDPVVLRSGNQALRILQHIRDEVHNHAIQYHRQVRSRNTITSVLEGIPGVGPTRRKALLRALGSASAVASASPDALAAVDGIGPAMADQIWSAFRPGRSPTDPPETP